MHIEDSTCAVFNSINVRGSLADRSIHIFIAILAAFSSQIPKNKIETIFSIKVALDKLTTNRNQIQAHWGLGILDTETSGIILSKQRITKALIRLRGCAGWSVPLLFALFSHDVAQIKKKWNRKDQLSGKVEQIQEVFLEAWNRNCSGEQDRQSFSIWNHLLSGHTSLNSHRARINNKTSRLCGKCQQPEDTNHYLFQCDSFKEERDIRDDSGRYCKQGRIKWHRGHWL